jgi:cytochrome c oxidase subunit 2
MPLHRSTSSTLSIWHGLAAILLLAGLGASAPPGRSEGPRTPQIIVHAKRFAFTPSEITLKKGQTTKLVLISDDVTHGLVVEGLGISAEIHKGRKTVVPVTPQRTGDFAGACSIFCGSGHRDMEFMIHVVD